jgi:hypothetical protein
MLLEVSHHTAGCSSHHPSNIFGFGRGKREEGAGVVGGASKDPVKHQAVKVRREIERGAKSLDKSDCAAVAAPHAVVLAGTPALVGEQCAQEGAQHLACESGVPRATITERIRKRQNPLTRGHLGKHAVDEVRGCVCHAPATARGT